MQIYKKQDMLTVNQFATRIGMSRSHIYNLIDIGPDNGGIIAFRFAGRNGLRIPLSELERFKQVSAVAEMEA